MTRSSANNSNRSYSNVSSSSQWRPTHTRRREEMSSSSLSGTGGSSGARMSISPSSQPTTPNPNSNNNANIYDLYDLQGDSRAALQVLEGRLLQHAAAAAASKSAASSNNPGRASSKSSSSSSSTANTGNNANTTTTPAGPSLSYLCDMYNHALLSYLASQQRNTSFVTTKLMQEWKNTWNLKQQQQHQSPTSVIANHAVKKRRNQWIIAYNEALLQFTSGLAQQAALHIAPLLRPYIAAHLNHNQDTKTGTTANKSSSNDNNADSDKQGGTAILEVELQHVGTNMAFLILDCILTTESHLGLKQWDSLVTSDAILDWLDAVVIPCMNGTKTANTASPVSASSASPNTSSSVKISAAATATTTSASSEGNAGRAAQVKFLYTLYKTRVDLASRTSGGKLVDSKVRSVKKELKLAMELFHHKLRSTTAVGTESVGSQSDSVETTSHFIPQSQQQQQRLSGGPNFASLPNSSSSSSHRLDGSTSSLASTGAEALLQAQNQAALNLKAHFEQLKGNTKKSLILCQEAAMTHPASTDVGSSTSYYPAMDANNLSIVYATSRKTHLALHTACKAIRQVVGNDNQGEGGENSVLLFSADGTAQPRHVAYAILHNAALSSLQGRNYTSAYSCLATCVHHSLIYRQRPRCWLRMAEACIGIHATKKHQQNDNQCAFVTVESNGKPKGIFLGETQDNHDDAPLSASELRTKLGSHADLEFVVQHPLRQAAYCLDVVMKLLHDPTAKKDPDCLESARCSQAFVKLEMKEYKQALIIANLVLMDNSGGGATSANNNKSTATNSKSENKSGDASKRNNTVSSVDDDGNGGLHSIMHRRRQATASLYACEASCALGDTRAALKFLTGDKQDESALDHLAMDLAGVLSIPTENTGSSTPTASSQSSRQSSNSGRNSNNSNNTASATTNQTGGSSNNNSDKDDNDNDRIRYRRAQAMVRTSASAASASMGALGPAKNLAMSAISLEDKSRTRGNASAANGRSSARKALLYCMLREGNRDGALAVLRSSR